MRLVIWDAIALFCNCDQSAIWTVPSVRLSVFLPPIMKFQEWLPMTCEMIMERIKVRGQGARSQTTKPILPQFGHFWAVTPGWIGMWLRHAVILFVFVYQRGVRFQIWGMIIHINGLVQERRNSYIPEIPSMWLWNPLTESLICFQSHKRPGPRLNIKTVLFRYGNFHVKDKTAVRTSYL